MPSSDVDSDVVRTRFGLVDVFICGAPPSSLNGGDDDPEHHDDALLPPGLDASRVVAYWRGDRGEQDRLIRTRAALHSSIRSSLWCIE